MPTGTGTTQAEYRRLLADELGMYIRTVVTAAAANGETTRLVLADELRDDEDGPDGLGGYWVYVVDGAAATEQRRVLSTGYEGNQSALILSRPFSSALAEGTTIEVTWPLPVRQYGRVRGLNAFVNQGLSRTLVEAKLAFTGNATRELTTAAYPWLDADNLIQGIYDSRVNGATNQPLGLSPYGVDLRQDGVSSTIVTETTYNTGEAFSLAVLVAGDRLVYDGASWAYAAVPGLVNDDHQAIAPLRWVVAIGMAKALQAWGQMVQTDRKITDAEKAALLNGPEGIIARTRRWTAAAASIIRDELPQATPKRSAPVVVGAGSSITSPNLLSGTTLPVSAV